MNNNLTEMVFILDMSGSMSSLTSDTIGGYNSLLEKQRELNKENPELKANVTTVLFDDRYIVIHDREDLDNVKDITSKEYQPLGMTAMLDAIGKTVVSVGQKLSDTPEEERSGLVSVTIITDGYENASREYKWEQVRNMIKEQKEKYFWMFAFIGADIDVEKTSLGLGIDADMAFSYTKSSSGVNSVYCCTTDALSTARGYVAQTSTSLNYNSVKNVIKEQYGSIVGNDSGLSEGE